MKCYFFLIGCLCLSFLGLNAQTKSEAETRISRKEVPKKAKAFLRDCCADHKVRWYKEKQLENYSYEAKFKKSGHLYSVEFSKKGVLEDVEQWVDESEIPEDIVEAIHGYLGEHFDRSRIQKIQIQYTGEEDDLEDLLEEDEWDDDIVIKYELVVLAKIDGEVKRWELLFNDQGELLERSQLIHRNQDNLNY